MGITKDTPLGEIKGYYRTTLLSALDAFEENLKKAEKIEKKIYGETAHIEDKREIVAEFRACLDANSVTSTEGTPMGRAIRQAEADGMNKHGHDAGQATLFDQLEPDGVDLMDDGVITMMLDLVNYNADADDIAAHVKEWARETRRDVYRWARAMQLAGTPASVHVKIPARPLVVKVEWLSSEITNAIAAGFVEPETLQPVNEMTDEQVGDWIGRGPWVPRAKSDADISPWILVWKGEQDGESHEYTFEHPDEATARKIAASINRMLAENDAKPEPSPESDGMDVDEMEYWLEIGPWAPKLVSEGTDADDTDEEIGQAIPEEWSLEWVAPLAAGEVAPSFTFILDSEGAAKREAARRNKARGELTDKSDAPGPMHESFTHLEAPALFALVGRDARAIAETLPSFDWAPLLEDLEIPTNEGETWNPPARNLQILAHRGPWLVEAFAGTEVGFIVKNVDDGSIIMAEVDVETIFPLGEALIWAAMSNAKISFAQDTTEKPKRKRPPRKKK